MKITKTLAILCVVGAGLFAFASCKDNSGDGDTSGNKWAITMTVDATGDNIKVGQKAITDSNNPDATDTIIADDATGEEELKLSKTGKRFFKEISAGFNNTEGFRTNIFLDLKNGTWKNADGSRQAGAGMLFDFYEYEKEAGKKTYDFFFLSFKPKFNGNAVDSVTCYFERYSGVKKYKEGIYSSHPNASALGSNYIQETKSYVTNANGPADKDKDYTLKTVGTWLDTLYNPVAGATCKINLTKDNGYYLDNDGNIIIGVNVKQKEKGVYTVDIGKVSYTVGETAQDFSPSAFKKSWRTTFAKKTTVGVCGETAAKTGDTGYIKDYLNWTHVDKKTKDSNLKGGVLVYGFAPYGTKPVASFYTCNNKLGSNTVDTDDSHNDYVGDWNVPASVDADDQDALYCDGGVVHEYVEY